MTTKLNVPSYDKQYAPGEYPPLPAPVNTQGLWGWVRTNLLATPKDTILSIILMLFLAHLIPSVANWAIFDATMTGQTSQQCVIAQRISAMNSHEIAHDVASKSRAGVVAPEVVEKINAQSIWTNRSMSASGQRFLLSGALFQSPHYEDVVTAETMDLPLVDSYLVNKSSLLSSIDRNVSDVVKTQEKELKAAEKLFEKPMVALNTQSAAEIAADPKTLGVVMKALDGQLKIIDIRRIYKDTAPQLTYEAIRAYQPYKFVGERNAEKYARAKAFFEANATDIKTAMSASQAATMVRAEQFLAAETKAMLQSVDYKQVKADFDVALETKDPAGLHAALSGLAPVMTWADNHDGACWTYIKERSWKALMFGSYPEFEKWRPILALILLFVALVPVLAPPFKGRGVLWIFTLLYPYVAYVLMTGDTIFETFVRAAVDGDVSWSWRVFLGVLLFGLAWLPMIMGVLMNKALQGLWWLLMLVLFGWLVTGDTFSAPIVQNLFATPETFDPMNDTSDFKLWGGAMLNIILGLTGIFLSLPIGVALALGRRSSLPVISWLCTMFIEVVRGVPLITILFMGALVFPFFVPSSWNIDALPRMITAITLFSSAYMAEVIRGGLQGLNKGQYEGAASLGLGYWKAHRLIILPQALKIVIPGIVNTFIGLFKDTTLVSVVAVGMFELLGTHNNHIKGNADWRSVENEGYVFVALFFFVCCFIMARYSIWLERRLDTGHRS